MTSGTMFGDAAQDGRLALRQLRRAPAFAFVAVLTLALGIGATTAIFSALNAVVLRPLPFKDPDQLVDIATEWQGGPGAVSVGNYYVMRERARTFAEVGARSGATFNLTEGGDPERVVGARATASYFAVLGMAPERGRVFTAEEDAPGAPHLAVLSHRLWIRRFGSDQGIVGKNISLSSVPHQVIGVMPAEFDLPGDDTEIWTQEAFAPKGPDTFDGHYLVVTARLKAGTSAAQLKEDVRGIELATREAAPRENEGRTFVETSLADRFIGDYRQRLFVLLGAVSLVLTIACVNVASLLLARGSARRREFAVRAALGASRLRIARQLLTEAFVLCLAGSLAGVALAALALPFFIAQAPAGIPRLLETRIDGESLAAAVAIAFAATLISGLVPALRESRITAAAAQATRGAVGTVRERARQAFVAAEVALALMLLMGAGVLLRSGDNLGRVAPGFDPDNVLTARLALPTAAYPGDERPAAAIKRMVFDLAGRAEVAEAAASSRPPLIGDVSYGLRPEGRGLDSKDRIDSRMQLVTSGYLETMRIALRAGRTFTEADTRQAPRVMIVSEELAARAWPGESPVGKRVACCEGGASPAWKEVVGVVANTRARGIGAKDLAEFYLPMDQAPSRSFDANGRSATLVARAKNGRPETLAAALRDAVRREDASVPLYDVATMSARVSKSTAVTRFNALLLSCLGALGLALSAIGVYGVIAFIVSQRTREISVRMALGAMPRDIVRLVVAQGMRAVVAGIAIGALGSLAQARALQGLLFNVSARDPLTLAIVASLLLALAVIAAAVPAARAARVEPTRALAEE